MSKAPALVSRSTLLHIAPEDLTLVTDKNHNLYDTRVELPPNESMVLDVIMHGVFQPVVVHKNGDDIEVVAGRSRVKAAIEANIRLKKEGKMPIKVPILPRDDSDANLYSILISENEVRNEDSAVNRGKKMRKLKNMGYTDQMIATTFKMSRQNVCLMLDIDGMASEVKDAIEIDEIKPTAALELKHLKREEQAIAMTALLDTGEKLTVEYVREFVAARAFENPVESDADNELDSEIDYTARFASVKFKPQPKKRLEKRLLMFEERGFNSDRYLQSKPADFQEGFAYALKWALGREQEEESFEISEKAEDTVSEAESED